MKVAVFDKLSGFVVGQYIVKTIDSDKHCIYLFPYDGDYIVCDKRFYKVQIMEM
jgi:hypothetical protein